ncbi:MAG: efflux RND transporter permease subunit, partial [Deltaproteobacteria bacterium]|nr:efflux RND transporter permease subunit [Deltaproteobacteria bacterium]
VSTVQGIEKIESVSSEGRSTVLLNFSWGMNLDSALNDVRANLDRVKNVLPEEADSPIALKFDISSFPIVFIGLYGEMEARELRQFADTTIKYRLERVSGVASVDIRGGLKREIAVDLDASRLAALNITIAEVQEAIAKSNMNLAGGKVYDGGERLTVRTMGEFSNIEEIRNVVVRRVSDASGEKIIFLKDIANVRDFHEDVTNVVKINGEDGIRLTISKQSDANSVDVSRKVLQEIEKINRDFKDKARLVMLMDTSQFIEDSISNLNTAIAIGGVICFIVLFFFLRSFSAALVVLLSIPISILATFIAMYLFKMTLNIISLGGLAIGVGMLVDCSIVVLENITRLKGAGARRDDPRAIYIEGATEMVTALTASTLTTICVFAPVLFLGGFAAVIFSEMALVVTLSLLISLVVSFTLIPVLAMKVAAVKPAGTGGMKFKQLLKRSFETVEAGYARLIESALNNRKRTFVVSFLCFILPFALFPLVGFELMPESDQNEVRVEFDLPPGTRLEETSKAAKEIEEIVFKEVPELDRMISVAGNPGYWRTSGEESGFVSVKLIPKGKRSRSSADIAQALRPLIKKVVTKGDLKVRAGEGFFLFRMLRGGGERLEVAIKGYDLNAGMKVAGEVKEKMLGIQGVSDALIDRKKGAFEVRIFPYRVKLASYGISLASFGKTIEAYINGIESSFFREKGEEYAIRVRLKEEDRADSQKIGKLPVATPAGVMPVDFISRVEKEEGWTSINREGQERRIVVSAGLEGTRDLGSITSELRGKLSETSDKDFSVILGGEFEEQKKTFLTLLLGFFLSVLLVYMVMASLYESYLQPLIIMFSMPFMLSGVLITLFLTP